MENHPIWVYTTHSALCLPHHTHRAARVIHVSRARVTSAHLTSRTSLHQCHPRNTLTRARASITLLLSSCLLYRRKLRSSLHRRHLKHASPWFPHMRAIHNKDPRYPCLILLHAVRVRFIEEKHLNGTYSSFKIFWAGICDENLIEIIITFFFVAKQQFNYDKMLFFYLEMNWEMYLFITAGQERDQRLVWMFKSASHPLDSLVYLDL